MSANPIQVHIVGVDCNMQRPDEQPGDALVRVFPQGRWTLVHTSLTGLPTPTLNEYWRRRTLEAETWMRENAPTLERYHAALQLIRDVRPTGTSPEKYAQGVAREALSNKGEHQ